MSSARDKPAALGSLLASSREAAARYAGTAIDREQWRRIVGERIAARTEPGAKRGRELTVHVASASWAQELSLLVNEIVARIRAAGVLVDTVRFRVKEVLPPPRDPSARKPAYRKAELPAPLSNQLGAIADPELRDAIAEAAALWLALEDAPKGTRGTLPPPARPSSPPAAPAAAQSTRSVTATVSERPGVRSPRDAGSQTVRSDRTTSFGGVKPRGKP